MVDIRKPQNVPRRQVLWSLGAVVVATAVAPIFAGFKGNHALEGNDRGPDIGRSDKQSSVPRQYVFASDPRARLDAFAVLPG